MMRTRIKICGITNRDDALAAIDAGADALGFIVYPPSPRCVTIEDIVTICKGLPPYVSLVALVVDASAKVVRQLHVDTPIDTIQFHGSESTQFLAAVDMPYYKKISLDSITFDAAAKTYSNASALLVDTPVADGELPGGSGRTFDWSLTKRNTAIPLILAGGLAVGNIAVAIQQVQPYAVDVNSGVEISPGRKSTQKMLDFVNAARKADSQT